MTDSQIQDLINKFKDVGVVYNQLESMQITIEKNLLPETDLEREIEHILCWSLTEKLYHQLDYQLSTKLYMGLQND